uniref:Uncharacterized protein n=1 Tax=Psilocybe cubensis TaxID=181762 RepID=A0A8H8CPA8_PSICU
MSEEDRAAKAARAKALLKKRQQKKAADSVAAVVSSTSGSPVVPSRTFSPAPEEDKRDLGDVFSADTSDTSWLTSLPRVTSSPPPAHIPPKSPPPGRRVSLVSPQAVAVPNDHPASSSATLLSADPATLQVQLGLLSKENETLVATIAQLRQFETAAQEAQTLLEAERKALQALQFDYSKLQSDTNIALANERETVSLLVTEKAHLTSELQKREEFESKAQALEEQLETEQTRSKDLTTQASELQTQVQDVSQRLKQLEFREKEILDRCKDHERQLHIATTAGAESRKEADEAQRKLRELEDQIQSDDRVERLESSLKNTQDRADELEFQVSKLKQSYASLKSEKEALDSQLNSSKAKESDWTVQRSKLESQVDQARKELTAIQSERNAIIAEKSKLQEVTETQSNTINGLEEKLTLATSALAISAKQAQNLQQDLKNAIRRADDAENTQRNLQAEGSRLMEAVDEMRPKIVELTSTKLELSERVENLEHTLRNRDSVISQLENDLGEAREQNEQIEATWKKRMEEQEKRHKETQNGVTDIQKAYTELQEELNSALASVKNLETQRTNQHQEASRLLEEVERLTILLQTQGEELDAVRHELEARNEAHEEEQDFLERAQNEIETLRAEISARDSEIEHLRESTKSPQSDAPRSLDDELLSSIRQQHAIEISAATSQIRALENTIFDKDSINHSLQKQINKLEEELAHLRSNSRLGPPSRPASRSLENDVRRSSLHSHRGNQPPLARTIFDHAMTPETRHKRKVSLSMLKARIESEAKPISQPASRALSPVHSEGHSRPSSVASVPHIHRPQFLDESHVFWCHSCQGDLVIL